MLFLMASYGLRSCEVVSLTLDDVDWRAGLIRIRQSKTRNVLNLPLIDEVAMVLIEYLRQVSRPGRLSQSLLSSAGTNQAAQARGPEGRI